MAADPLLHAAVINNARWCDAVCRSHGYPGEFGGRLWISAGHALPFYPNAITLSPDVTAAAVDQRRPRPAVLPERDHPESGRQRGRGNGQPGPV